MLNANSYCWLLCQVAPFTGAWIEIIKKETYDMDDLRRTLHGCVD